LNDCYRELSETIAARPVAIGDCDLWEYDYAALSGGPDGAERQTWIHRCRSNDVALAALRSAVTNGDLQLWTYGVRGEIKVDRHELKGLTLRTFTSGIYQPDNRADDFAGLADRPLWVKEADWHHFVLDQSALRYGIDRNDPAPLANKFQLPPNESFVTLSHAITWIAFGISMGSDHLHEVLSLDRYGRHSPQEVIPDAVARLTDLGSAGRVAIRGKPWSVGYRDDKTVLIEIIDPIKLTNYRKFSYLDDELFLGDGVMFWRDEDGAILNHMIVAKRTDSYVQVEVDRAALLREFPPQMLTASDVERFPVGHAFTREDPASIAPWWSINQALAWIATRIPSYVDYIGNLETDEPRESQPYVVQVICEAQIADSDEGKAFVEGRRLTWPDGTILAHAGRDLLGTILSGEIRPMARENGQGRQMLGEEFAGVARKTTGSDWLDLTPQPILSSAEIMRIFPFAETASAQPAITITSTAKAESECRDWLASEFAADAEKRRPKKYFRKAALNRFNGRLSARGFDNRVWARLAEQNGRSQPGAKPKS